MIVRHLMYDTVTAFLSLILKKCNNRNPKECDLRGHERSHKALFAKLFLALHLPTHFDKIFVEY